MVIGTALADYHAGARARSEMVAAYYRRLGLDDLLERPDFGAGAASSQKTWAISAIAAKPEVAT
jgi:hypothetical protein